MPATSHARLLAIPAVALVGACNVILGLQGFSEGGAAGAGATDAGGAGAGGAGAAGAGGSVVPWPDGDWTGRRAVTLDTSQWPEESLQDFPLAVVIPHTAARVLDDDEVLFTTRDGVELVHEVERGDVAFVTAWVRVPLPSPPAQVELYFYEGGQRATDPKVVWSDGYEGVWHFDDDLTLLPKAARDSSPNAYHALASHGSAPTSRSGMIGHAMRFSGDENESLEPAVDTNLAMGTDSFTVSVWVSATTSHSTEDTPVWRGGADPATGYAVILANNGWMGRVRDQSGNVVRAYFGTGLNTGDWVHLAYVVDRPNQQLRGFLNGTLFDTDPLGALNNLDNSIKFQISRSVNQPYRGDIDELRVERTVRSDAWIALLHHTVDELGDRLSVGPLEARPE